MAIDLFVEFADRSGRDFGAPECLSDIFNTPDRYSSQVHFDQGFFDAALTALVALDDRCFERKMAHLGHFQSDFAGFGQQFAVVVAGTGIPALFASLVSGGVGNAVRFRIK